MRRIAVALTILWLMPLALQPAAARAGAANKLADAASPYLRLHATDPVHWHPWSAEALAEAKAVGKPILLSVGYLACHWCHVMQEESYADPATAELINDNFFPIIVDREERPDLDHTFQNAALALNLPTGWPLNLFMTPDAQPFFGGTYFPKEARGGMASFSTFLGLVAKTYAEDPHALAAEAAAVLRRIEDLSAPRAGAVTLARLDAVAGELLAQADGLAGGFGADTKFPDVTAQEMLWRAFLRTGKPAYGDAVRLALAQMVDGGLFDHLSGGFFRYTADPLWQQPHFEKMLDTNAALLGLMTEVWRETRDAVLERRIEQTVAFMMAELRHPAGAFAAALDADSLDADGRHGEGAFYLWRKADIEALLGADAGAFFAVFDMAAPDGGEAGVGLPVRREPGDRAAAAERKIPAMLATLKAARDGRPRPRRDGKVLADWNGMAVRALTEAAGALGRDDWLRAAREIFDIATKSLSGADGRLRHAFVPGHGGDAGARTGGPATAADLGQMALAALALYEATDDGAYLKRAVTWADTAIDHHWDGTGAGFFASADDAGPVPLRTKIFIDNPDPGGNAVLLDVLARLYYATGKTRWRDHADKILAAYGGLLARVHPGVGGLANAAETVLAALQVVIVGEPGKAGFDALKRTVMRTSLPGRSLQVVGPGEVLPDGHPAQYKEQIDGRATAYVCRGPVCSLPAVTIPELKDSLAAMRRGG